MRNKYYLNKSNVFYFLIFQQYGVQFLEGLLYHLLAFCPRYHHLPRPEHQKRYFRVFHPVNQPREHVRVVLRHIMLIHHLL